jgi:hypothetical protein
MFETEKDLENAQLKSICKLVLLNKCLGFHLPQQAIANLQFFGIFRKTLILSPAHSDLASHTFVKVFSLYKLPTDMSFGLEGSLW